MGMEKSYVKPEEVLSPRSRVRGVVEVIHDPGADGMSVARILWDDEEVIATRWNGNAEPEARVPLAAGDTWGANQRFCIWLNMIETGVYYSPPLLLHHSPGYCVRLGPRRSRA
jgi:hypothetical protein